MLGVPQLVKALDLFCGAGGATRGLQLAGFDVTGVDLVKHLHYCGDHFFQEDALSFPLDGYDLIWASPPCQFATRLTPGYRKHLHHNLIPQTRARLVEQGTPYIIENVADARKHLISPVMLCGSMFGLGVWRHRFFECSFHVWPPATCDHSRVPVLVSGAAHRKDPVTGIAKRREHPVWMKKEAIGIDWMNREEMDLAIPPAFAEYLANQFKEG